MGLIGDLVSEFTHSGHKGPNQSSQGPPPVSPPWYAEWDSRDNCWLFVNQQTGERTFTYPGPGYAQQQGNYGGPHGGYGQNPSGYSNQGAYNQGSYNPNASSYEQQEHEKKHGGNGWKYAAAGAAGVAGGALLMHEGSEIKDDFERDKYEMENRVDQFGNDVENFPENAAGWTGQQVGRVENFGDNAINDVENFPENAAAWTGEKVQAVEDIPQDMENRWDNAVGDVEAFGGRMDAAYDDGRDEQRYEDEDNGGDW